MSAAADTEQPHPAMGQTFGSYEVKAVLGEGGMGEVFLAEHQRLGRQVALKRLKKRFAKNRKTVKRFVDEAWAIGQIQHVNIVKVTDFVLGEDEVYYIMELLDGRTLAEELARSGAVPPSRAVRIACEVAAALDAVHAKGFVHGDIKPSNIFLAGAPDGGDLVKLLDFGIATLVHGDREEDDDTGAQLVTPVYMSPEQANRQPIDSAADLYSLGAVLYHMLAGRPPFKAATFAEYVYKHTQEEPAPLGSAAPREQQLSRELERAVHRCLAKEPSARFPSARTLGEALEAAPLQRPPVAGAWAPLLGTDRTGYVTRLCLVAGAVALLVALLTWWKAPADTPGRAPLSAAATQWVMAPDATAARPRPPTPVLLRIESEPPRALVRRRSPRPRILGLTPLVLKRPPRSERWQLEVCLDGYKPQTLEISPTTDLHRRVVLRPVTPPPPTKARPPAVVGRPRRPPPPRVTPRPVDPRGTIDPFRKSRR